eukprot:4725740-Prymnesium_polylepis.1
MCELAGKELGTGSRGRDSNEHMPSSKSGWKAQHLPSPPTQLRTSTVDTIVVWGVFVSARPVGRGAVKLSPRKGPGEGSHRSERGRCAREVQR